MVMAADISKEFSAFFGFKSPRTVKITTLFISEFESDKFVRNFKIICH
jgi:hypothetical protein